KNKTKVACNILKALINQVEAQRDKHISNAAANNLIFHARYLLNSLQEEPTAEENDVTVVTKK
ncbi:MAG: hypothetical protein KAJ33_07220, partial [Thermoplasmata archaeon]|nr:hypothetical protein [Thermoplasmata archaeon]